ncbi:hypothetical protein A3L12_08175 [Thermococcus sp. P6]|uniref:hypothetical protein n=1 Tax=Thermococcus sp. P6 TaxID=122420 RepID=UPI000B5A078C|nr:hypothetical protein [Thermococcus sp. P6]ASJ11271.1 hypothetical protein A3L12_08175 [Thermococcus sp. P6]
MKCTVLDFISVAMAYGIIAYSTQLLGFYAMLQLMSAPIWKMWVAIIGVGIKFLLQVSIIWFFIRIMLGYNLKTTDISSAFVPLIIAGIFCFVLRFVGYFILTNVYLISLRHILENISMAIGWFLSLYLLGKKISLSPLKICGIGLLVYFVLPPI